MTSCVTEFMRPRVITITLTTGLYCLSGWAYGALLAYTPTMHPLLPTKPLSNSETPRPLPKLTPNTNNNKLTLKDAILIAMHHNPKLSIDINNRRLSRYDLITAEQNFVPQFSVVSSVGYTRSVTKSSDPDTGDTSTKSITRQANIGPEMTWNLPYGTNISANFGYTPSEQSGSNANNGNEMTWTVTLTQPLLKNFGSNITELNLHNEQDTQVLDNYQLLDSVSQTISTIISDYYSLVQAQLALNISAQSLQQTRETLTQRKVSYQFGRVAKDDVDQAALDVETQEQSYTQAKTSYVNAKAKLLNDLGLPGNTQFNVDDKLDVTPLHPNMGQSQTLALKNNRTYLEAKLNYKIADRNLLKLANNRRWELDLNLSQTHSRTNTNYAPATELNSSNNVLNNTSASLDLTIPLDGVSIAQSHLQQAVDDENAQVNFTTAKRSLMTQVADLINQLNNSWTSLQISQRQLKLQKATYQAAVLKVKFGKLDTFSLSQQQENLIEAENNLVVAKINYITLKTQYKQLMGSLLKDWHIHIKLPHEDSGLW